MTISSEQILEFHSQEVKLILYICASDLTAKDNDELVCFAEDIEGRIDVLFQSDVLDRLEKYIQFDKASRELLFGLRDKVVSIFSPQWSKKMQQSTPEWEEIREISNRILESSNIGYVDPSEYVEQMIL